MFDSNEWQDQVISLSSAEAEAVIEARVGELSRELDRIRDGGSCLQSDVIVMMRSVMYLILLARRVSDRPWLVEVYLAESMRRLIVLANTPYLK